MDFLKRGRAAPPLLATTNFRKGTKKDLVYFLHTYTSVKLDSHLILSFPAWRLLPLRFPYILVAYLTFMGDLHPNTSQVISAFCPLLLAGSESTTTPTLLYLSH